MNKHICVREAFDWIHIGDRSDDLTSKEYEGLTKYLDVNIVSNEKIIEHKYNKIRFINYVGILNVKGVTIEVLPKISLDNDRIKDKKILLQMLSTCADIKINLDKAIDSTIQNYNLLELIANKYLDTLLKEINKGIFHEYVKEEANLNIIKGKILIKEHVKRNYVNKGKVFCGYDEYSSDNILNQILKLACVKILNKVQNNTLINKAKKAAFNLSNISNIYISKEVLNRVKLNKQNNRFSECLELAKFILLNISNESSVGNKDGFSMLFEMNVLYEKYIGKLIKKICANKGKKVLLQDTRNYLLLDVQTNKRNFNLRPDIVIEENNVPTIIIDTKWKAIEYQSKNSYRTNDIYQMYAYINSYKEVKRVVLLYPCLIEGKEYTTWSLLNDNDKFIEVKTVRLDDYKNTIKDLEKIIIF